MPDLKTTLLQCELAWENAQDNRQHIEDMLRGLAGTTDLIVLPEMFTTGFSMNSLANAEQPGGASEQWLQTIAQKLDCAVTGSIAVHAEQGVYNRMLFVTPHSVAHYDKRHLFRMAGEHERYVAGKDRVVVPWRGWRINLQVCYDLRFPVFSRCRNDYDLILYVANWPAKRRMHWRQLLLARAIENQACVIGVNRIGSDVNGLDYSGDSLAVAADGQLLLDMHDDSGIGQVALDHAALQDYRQGFPCHMDADRFHIE